MEVFLVILVLLGICGVNCGAVLCQAGYTLRKPADLKASSYCTKQIPPRPWNEAMDECFGGHYLNVEPIWDYNAYSWIQNTISYLSYNDSSDLLREALWLPSRRRVPGGPLYPYLTPKNERDLNLLNDWEVNIAGRNPPQIDYGSLEADKLCLAWYVQNRTLITLSCSEKHPTLCVKQSRNGSLSRGYEITNPADYNIAGCLGFDSFVPNEFGINSCYKILPVPSPANFTCEKAKAQCKTERRNVTLAIPMPSGVGIRNLIKNKSSGRGFAWVGIWQSASGSNSSCELTTSSNDSMNYVYYDPSNIKFQANVSDRSLGELAVDLPRIRLVTVCQIDFIPLLGAKAPVIYRLTLAWEDSQESNFVLRILEESKMAPSDDSARGRRRNRLVIYERLSCFRDGTLLNMTGVIRDDSLIKGTLPDKFVSFFCESMAADTTFLRSNTLLERETRFTFTLAFRNQSVCIESPRNDVLEQNRGPKSNNTENYMSSRNLSKVLTKAQFADRFEPSKGTSRDSRFSSAFQTQIRSLDFSSRSWEPWHNYTLTNPRYGIVSVTSGDYDNLLVRYHVVFNGTNETRNDVYNQLREDITFVLDDVDINFRRYEVKDGDIVLRSMTTCLREVVQFRVGNLTFLETSLGETTFSTNYCTLDCGSLVQRTCIGDIYHGAYWGPVQAANKEGILEDLSDDFSCAEHSNTTTSILNILEITENASSILAQLQRVTSEWEEVTTADFQLVSLLLLNSSRTGNNFTKIDLTRTADILRQVLRLESATLANAQRISNVTTNILKSIEGILVRGSGNSSIVATTFRGDRIELEKGFSEVVFTADSNQLDRLEDTVQNTTITCNQSMLTIDNTQHDVKVKLNESSLITLDKSIPSIAFIYYPSIHLADAAREVGRNIRVFSPDPSNGDQEKLLPINYTANSAMVQIASTCGATPPETLEVKIFFRPFLPLDGTTSSTLSTVVCVSWNALVNDGIGGWSTRGCRYMGKEQGLDFCQCDHMSTITTLWQINNEIKPAVHVHDAFLVATTMIGSGLSLIGLLGVISTYVLFPKWREPKPKFYGHHIIFQLSLALTALLVTFLLGVEQTDNPQLCLLVAVSLHYFTLAVFFWMFIGAYYHYSLFVAVWGINTSRFMTKAVLFAWGVPVMVPLVTVLTTHTQMYHYMNQNKYCWLNPRGFICVLLPFLAAIGMFNLIVYVLVMVRVFCVRSQLRTNQTNRQTLTHYTAIGISFLLGLTWIFGLIALDQARTFFSYLFVIFTSLQGFAIFLLFICRGQIAREQWRNFFQGKSNRDQARERLTASVANDLSNRLDLRRVRSSDCSSNSATP